jgi:hypothetical protein
MRKRQHDTVDIRQCAGNEQNFKLHRLHRCSANKFKYKKMAYITVGLFGDPFFSALAPIASTGASLLKNWAKGTPPGGRGSCLVQYKGAMYNGSCDKKSNFGCEEKPLWPGVTTTLYYFNLYCDVRFKLLLAGHLEMLWLLLRMVTLNFM